MTRRNRSGRPATVSPPVSSSKPTGRHVHAACPGGGANPRSSPSTQPINGTDATYTVAVVPMSMSQPNSPRSHEIRTRQARPASPNDARDQRVRTRPAPKSAHLSNVATPHRHRYNERSEAPRVSVSHNAGSATRSERVLWRSERVLCACDDASPETPGRRFGAWCRLRRRLRGDRRMCWRGCCCWCHLGKWCSTRPLGRGWRLSFWLP